MLVEEASLEAGLSDGGMLWSRELLLWDPNIDLWNCKLITLEAWEEQESSAGRSSTIGAARKRFKVEYCLASSAGSAPDNANVAKSASPSVADAKVASGSCSL
ncbi:uncharacterized protein MELLADRAFT_114015 [Melampsora larici-populina 98AG31]|uniref:Uncharacterized protein n=1 Tax=Melampsora larici-populina (strain 98AG31 / pathotype 3-4-7) TaxID=747676 RepID=F4SBV2_MELLP|nr:uncharacterized protein MELLADRAFT_114015 [Melampsora larici-populina 98AG31]EGF97863.1 hypothetical protein MELLADRAFT_114015 [Melampsora larici-populina 98AG31]